MIMCQGPLKAANIEQLFIAIYSIGTLYLCVHYSFFRELSRLLLLESAAKAAERGKWGKKKVVNVLSPFIFIIADNLILTFAKLGLYMFAQARRMFLLSWFSYWHAYSLYSCACIHFVLFLHAMSVESSLCLECKVTSLCNTYVGAVRRCTLCIDQSDGHFYFHNRTRSTDLQDHMDQSDGRVRL